MPFSMSRRALLAGAPPVFVALPGRFVTNLAFGGKDLRTGA
jgi:hypothetical protein